VKYNSLFENFKGKKILVIGDLMLDTYVLGKVTRISPEAPVPIIALDKKENRIGGAGNVALNLMHLGAKPNVVSVIGTDSEGNDLMELFHKRGIPINGIIKSEHRKTTVKTRVISSKQQILRIDSEDTHPISAEIENSLHEKISDLIQDGFEAVIIEDYNKGVLTKKTIQFIIELANKNNIPVAADPKKDHFYDYSGLTLFKPNLKELKEGMNVEFDFIADKSIFEQSVRQLREQIPHDITLVTLSENGVYAIDESQSCYAKAHPRDITDVSGAGDTVIATATLCYVCGASLKEIAQISNIAGGMVCEKPGVVSISIKELQNEVEKLL